MVRAVIDGRGRDWSPTRKLDCALASMLTNGTGPEVLSRQRTCVSLASRTCRENRRDEEIVIALLGQRPVGDRPRDS